MSTGLPEVWMRGPLAGVPALLQPVAHALLQAVEDVKRILREFPGHLLWERPAGVASVGFHLQHLCGVLQRMGAYAQGQSLSATQLAALEAEGRETGTTAGQFVAQFEAQVELMLQQLRHTPESSLTEFRPVGRKQLPSTVIGLLFHAAEHTQRHVGQLLVTVRFLIATQS